MNVNLIELEMASVDLAELNANVDKSYKSIFRMSRMIDSSCGNLLRSIYDYNAVGKDFPRYLLAPEWNECCSQFRSRCLVVSVNGDFVVVPLKLNQNPKHPWQYNVSFKPVSVFGNVRNEISVLEALSAYCIKDVVVGESQQKNSVDNNYYNTRQDFHLWMDKSKWRSKHGIRKLSELIEFRSEWYGGIEDDIAECGSIWNGQRKERGLKPHSIKCDIAFAKKRVSPFCYSFFCNGKIVGYMLPLTFERCAAIAAAKSIASDVGFCQDRFGIDPQDAHLAVKQVGRYMQYEMHKDLLAVRNYDAVYYYGDVGEQPLKNFKEMMFKNKIWYNRYSIKEYIEMLENGERK